MGGGSGHNPGQSLVKVDVNSHDGSHLTRSGAFRRDATTIQQLRGGCDPVSGRNTGISGHFNECFEGYIGCALELLAQDCLPALLPGLDCRLNLRFTAPRPHRRGPDVQPGGPSVYRVPGFKQTGSGGPGFRLILEPDLLGQHSNHLVLGSRHHCGRDDSEWLVGWSSRWIVGMIVRHVYTIA